MIKRSIICLIFIFILHSDIFSQYVFIGPMIHYNIGGKKNNKFSFGLEVSYWSPDLFATKFSPKSIDLGIEYEDEKIRVYSEVQAGILIGLSLGYVREYKSLYESNGGFQGSIWGAIFLGADLRYRYINKNNFFAPGIFFKFPTQSEHISM